MNIYYIHIAQAGRYRFSYKRYYNIHLLKLKDFEFLKRRMMGAPIWECLPKRCDSHTIIEKEVLCRRNVCNITAVGDVFTKALKEVCEDKEAVIYTRAYSDALHNDEELRRRIIKVK